MAEENTTKVPPTGKRGGVWVPIGEEEYRIPPLGFRSIQDLADDVAGLAEMGAKPTAAQMQVVARIVHAAMARNYPALSVDDVHDMLDLGNYQRILDAVLAGAGFVQVVAGGVGPGEAPASIGTASMPA